MKCKGTVYTNNGENSAPCEKDVTDNDVCGFCPTCLVVELEFAYSEEWEARKNLEAARKRVFDLGGGL